MGTSDITLADVDALREGLIHHKRILIGGAMHDDPAVKALADQIPTIHEMGTGAWERFKVRHCGFGVFLGKDRDGHKIVFDGGGAMHRETHVSWSALSFIGPDTDNRIIFPYDSQGVAGVLDALRDRLLELAANAEAAKVAQLTVDVFK